ncbi:anthranilate phosphoribosyltransferase [Actinobaculum sp. 313]|uniref:anthranilate phosphoribosyltransferase n=1 Tax=Actinobaculum sp. 313 TaxID=2495645 RepID=UPI000D527C6E|nr:anthranilate phosphoribosyltransferase [Actinobaculum sp. 313]AWE42531.1 anthranilate phosphoribosyltransferase [Actinobaculum sp. 313]
MSDTRSWPDLTSRLISHEDLSSEDTAWAMDQVMSGETSPVVLAGFLTALAAKGETPSELRGLADAMLSHALPISVSGPVLDIVGTGGDRLRTVNISTTAAMVIAAAGVPLVKHGNRASSSASGAADCLEALGVNLMLPVEGVERCFHELGITFIFANVFHPSMRFAAQARRELGVATAFNVLGPLTNPARPDRCVIGVSSARHAPIVAGVLAERGTSSLVFRGANGMDELSAVTSNQVWEIRDGHITEYELDAVEELGLAPATVEDLRGEDAAFNADVTRRVLAGETGAVRDAVTLNAAAALVADGTRNGTRVSDGSFAQRMAAGLDIARQTIDSGAASDLLDRWVTLSQKLGTP